MTPSRSSVPIATTAALRVLILLGLGVQSTFAAVPQSSTTVIVQTTTTTIVQYGVPRTTPVPHSTNVCTTTVTQWADWKAAPTPPADFGLTCEDGVLSRGHELAYIPPSALLSQSLEAVHYHYNNAARPGLDPNAYNTLYWCCETCLGSSDCAFYQFNSGAESDDSIPVCTHYIVKQGSGTKSIGYCPAGIFEVDEAPSKQHKSRTQTGTDSDNLYNGGILPGPCFAAGKLSSWECDDGKWAGGGKDFVIDP